MIGLLVKIFLGLEAGSTLKIEKLGHVRARHSKLGLEKFGLVPPLVYAPVPIGTLKISGIGLGSSRCCWFVRSGCCFEVRGCLSRTRFYQCVVASPSIATNTCVEQKEVDSRANWWVMGILWIGDISRKPVRVSIWTQTLQLPQLSLEQSDLSLLFFQLNKDLFGTN